MRLRRARRSETADVAVWPPLLFAACFLLGLLLRRLVSRSLLPRRLRWPAGAALVGISTLTALSALRTMDAAGTSVDVNEPVRALVTSGPFRRTRNPLYLSAVLLYSGIALITNTLSALLILPGLLAILQRGVIEREERYLERRFGREYIDYKRRVPRWL